MDSHEGPEDWRTESDCGGDSERVSMSALSGVLVAAGELLAERHDWF